MDDCAYGSVGSYCSSLELLSLIETRTSATAVFRSPNALAESIQAMRDLDDVLPDTMSYWTGYPLSRKPIPFRINLLMRQRCVLTKFISEFVQLLFPEIKRQDNLYTAAKSLSNRLNEWHEHLPTELQYATEMPPSLFEFQYVT